MAAKISALPLQAILNKDARYVQLLLEEGENIICLNRATGKTRTIAFRALFNSDKEFWRNPNSAWDYYLDKSEFETLKSKLASREALSFPLGQVTGAQVPSTGMKTASQAAEKPPEPEPNGPAASANRTSTDAYNTVNFGEEYQRIEAMSLPARIETVEAGKKLLDDLAGRKDAHFEEVAGALVETSRDAALINRATILEAMRLGDEEAKKLTQNLVDSTNEMVKSSTKLISEDIFNDDLIKTLVSKSNGTVIQHMTRVFLNGVAFMNYYNNLVLTSSVANKIRIVFEKKYKNYYRKLLPHLHKDDVTLERVFQKGLQAVPESEFHNFATGFLIHDIGKANAIEYHEGEAAYDRKTVVDHVKIGYKAVMNKTNYPRQAGLITGYHHEYYGNSNGYGYFRALLARYKEMNPKATQDFCISYEMEPILDYEALAYFPAKLLEIIDVFDSLTDPNRKYRKPLSPPEALDMLRTEFLEKELKIDPILFDLFAEFINRKK